MATDAASPSSDGKPSTQPPPSPAETDLTSTIKSITQCNRLLFTENPSKIPLTPPLKLQIRFSEIISTSQAHFSQTIDSLQDVKSEIGDYEDKLFGKVKEEINVAALHPLIPSAVAVGLGLLILR